MMPSDFYKLSRDATIECGSSVHVATIEINTLEVTLHYNLKTEQFSYFFSTSLSTYRVLSVAQVSKLITLFPFEWTECSQATCERISLSTFPPEYLEAELYRLPRTKKDFWLCGYQDILDTELSDKLCATELSDKLCAQQMWRVNFVTDDHTPPTRKSIAPYEKRGFYFIASRCELEKLRDKLLLTLQFVVNRMQETKVPLFKLPEQR